MTEKETNNFVIYYLYPDKNNMHGDEWGIEVELNGEVIVEYGDYYHDKGSERAKGFIDGVIYVKGWDNDEYIIHHNNKIKKSVWRNRGPIE